jgi:hypothetical protein
MMPEDMRLQVAGRDQNKSLLDFQGSLQPQRPAIAV